MIKKVSGESIFMVENNPLIELLKEKKIKVGSIKLLKDGLAFSLCILAKPGAKREEVKISEEGSLKIFFRERPIEGAANKKIISVLSDIFKIPSSQINLLSGEKSKEKRFELLFLFTIHKNVAYYLEKIGQNV